MADETMMDGAPRHAAPPQMAPRGRTTALVGLLFVLRLVGTPLGDRLLLTPEPGPAEDAPPALSAAAGRVPADWLALSPHAQLKPGQVDTLEAIAAGDDVVSQGVSPCESPLHLVIGEKAGFTYKACTRHADQGLTAPPGLIRRARVDCFAMLRRSLLVGLVAAALACEDGHNNCGSWADGGECTANPAFMKDTCSESCGFCTPSPLPEASDDALLGSERVVMQIQWGESFGEIVLGFYPSVAPVTVAHILRLVRMGGYNTNEIFRVDKGFVAQVQGVDGGRRATMNRALRAVAKQNVPDEFSSTLKHTRGMLSMGKFDAPGTGTSSFSMLLGTAASLDRRYTIFGRVLAGDGVLAKLEKLETVREGIFVKPKQRIEIVSAVVMYADGRGGLVLDESERRKSEL